MTVRITVRVMGALGPRPAARLEFPGSPPTVGEVVARFLDGFPELNGWIGNGDGGVLRNINVFVGDVNIRDLDGLDTATDPTKEVWLVNPQAGG